MKLILTGAAGFIGSCFLWKLNQMGIDRVVAVDADPAAGDGPNLASKRFLDYLGRDALLKALEKGQLSDTDGIVHLGACTDTTETDREYLWRNNVAFSQTLARWALAGGRRFHYASSAAVYGDGARGYADDPALWGTLTPLNLYGESKRAFDLWVRDEGLLDRVVGYRYFNVFGPNEYEKGEMRSMVAKAFEQIQKTGRVQLFASTRPGYPDGSEERDFVYVKDVVDVMAFFLEHPEAAGVFNVGTGVARSFKDLALAVFAALGRAPAIDFVPMPEKLKGQYQYFTQADVSSLRRAGYAGAFRSLEASVADYVQEHLNRKNPVL